MAKQRGAKTWPTRNHIAVVVAAAVVLFAVSGMIWWRQIYNDPQRAFWNMLSNSLSTSSVTRHVIETNQDGRQDQVTRLSLGGQSIANAQTTLDQITPRGDNIVMTQTIGTPHDDLARYISIDTPQRNANNQPLDFSSVLGTWGKSSETAQFLSGTILNVIPFAPLSAQARQQVLQTMRDRKVYTVNYTTVARRSEQGRSAFVYSVSMNASAYVSMLKSFAKQVGMKQLDNVDPAAYAQSAPEEIQVAVDRLTNQLLSITYSGGLRKEIYSGYGLQRHTTIPKQTISVQELQSRLQAIH